MPKILDLNTCPIDYHKLIMELLDSAYRNRDYLIVYTDTGTVLMIHRPISYSEPPIILIDRGIGSHCQAISVHTYPTYAEDGTYLGMSRPDMDDGWAPSPWWKYAGFRYAQECL